MFFINEQIYEYMLLWHEILYKNKNVHTCILLIKNVT
jgi:hypothetical protein